MRASLALVLLVGCSPMPKDPRPGDPCDGGEPFTCFSIGTKGVCEKGHWLEYPCDGTFVLRDGGTYVGRCLSGAPQQCLMPVPVAGDYCPSAYEGRIGRCISNDAIALCRNETWGACPAKPLGSRPGCEDFLRGSETEGVSSSWTPAAPDAGC